MEKSFLRKYIESVLAILAVYVLLFFFFLVFLNIPLAKYFFPGGIKFTGIGIPSEIFLTFFPFLGGLYLAYDWRAREKAGVANPVSWHGVFREVVAVALAIVIFLFAYFFNQLPYYRGELTTSDTIADSLDKSQLLGILIKKNPFLRSTIIIGFFFSAVLLLFKSSRRAGARFAVILFIIVSLLLGYFSNLEQPGIFILVFGFVMAPCLYLLSLPAKGEVRDRSTFLRELPVIFRSPGNIVKLTLVVFMAYGFVDLVNKQNQVDPIQGKWKIVQLERNGAAVNLEAWQQDSLAWNKAYIERRRSITFNPSPYLYEAKRSSTYLFRFDTSEHRVMLGKTNYTGASDEMDTLQEVSIGKNQMEWSGKWGADSVRMLLAREQ
jgi:hypothetical protein